MPARPPKAWFRRAVLAIRRNRTITDPEALAAWMWYHGMKETTKAEILRAERSRKRKGKRFFVGGDEIHIDVHSHNAKMGKTMAGKRKHKRRKASTALKKQINALRRKVRKAAKRAGVKPFYFTGKKARAGRSGGRGHSLSQGGFMQGKRKRRPRRRTRHSGLSGFEGRRRRGRRRRGLLMGAGRSGGPVRAITQGIVPVLVAVAGAGASAFALGKLPAKINPMLRASIPLVGGLLITGMIRNRLAESFGLGVATIGGYTLLRQAAPTMLPALSGSDEVVDAATLGLGAEVQALGYERTAGQDEEDVYAGAEVDALGQDDDEQGIEGEDENVYAGAEVEAL